MTEKATKGRGLLNRAHYISAANPKWLNYYIPQFAIPIVMIGLAPNVSYLPFSVNPATWKHSALDSNHPVPSVS